MLPGDGRGGAAERTRAEDGYDVVVVGAGGAGLLAACVAADTGARVVVVEREPVVGGTTAISGGHMWVPSHRHLVRAGMIDSIDDARTYMRRVAAGAVSTTRIETFLRHAPSLVTYLEDDLEVAVFPVRRPDYHPTWDGARDCRTVEPRPLSASTLGVPATGVRRSPTRPPLTSEETRAGADPELIARREAAEMMTQGAALVGGLLRGCVRRGVQVITGCRLHELIHDQAGRICGVAGGSTSRPRRILADQVILASGGFESNAKLRSDLLAPVRMWPVSPPGHDGDGLVMGLRAGAALRMPGEAWWTAAIQVPGHEGRDEQLTLNVVRELARPGAILVNREGRRFVDEASPYNELGKAFLRFDTTRHAFPNAAAWLIFDANYQRRYGIGPVRAGSSLPPWVLAADTLDGLATLAEIDAASLTRTVTAFNAGARSGEDPEFDRGGNIHDRYNGDAQHLPNPCLGPVETPPFGAVAVGLGLNGTKGGLDTDSHGRVISATGGAVERLYACGDVAAATMGLGYAGSGASLGPGLVMAMLAGRAAAAAACAASTGKETPA